VSNDLLFPALARLRFVSAFFFSALKINLLGLSHNCGAELGTPRISTIAPRWSALHDVRIAREV